MFAVEPQGKKVRKEKVKMDVGLDEEMTEEE